MADVIKFVGKAPEPEPDEDPDIWICACGCATHFLLNNGETACPSCGDQAPGIWKPSGPVLESNQEDTSSFIVYRPGEPVDVRIARFKRAVDQEGMLAGVIFNKDGRVISLFEIRSPDTPEDRKWWEDRIEDFKKQVFLDG